MSRALFCYPNRRSKEKSLTEEVAAPETSLVPIRTYIDSGVLICAAVGERTVAEAALPFLSDSNRAYIASDFVRLEVLPKPIFERRRDEAAFYEAFLSSVAYMVKSSTAVTDLAYSQASKYGLSAVDALHVACAIIGQADELITSEKTSKPIHRVTVIKVISIFK